MARHNRPNDVEAIKRQAIASESQFLSSHHGLDQERVRSVLATSFDSSVLERVNSLPGEFYEKEPSRLFHPSLRDAIEHLGPERALSLFEQSIPKIKEQQSIIDYLTDKGTPFRTLTELQQFTSAAINNIELNRQPILITGEGVSKLRGFRWPNLDISKTYYTKLPSRIHIVIDLSSLKPPVEPTAEPPFKLPVGEIWHGRTWCNSEEETCSFQEASVLEGLDSGDAQRLDEGRNTVLNLKESILNELDKALTARSIHGLWESCLHIITSAITADEADFYLRMDRWYDGYDIRSGEVIDEEAGLIPGGLSFIFELIGHYEKEMVIGSMSRTKSELAKLGLEMRVDAGFYSDQSAVMPTNFFYHAVAAGQGEELNNILEKFRQREEQEQHFWEEYRDRVNTALAEEFFTEVTIRTKVKRKHVAKFEPRVRLFAKKLKADQEFADDIGYASEALLSGPITASPENEFRKVGDYWDIKYQRGEPMRLKDSKGLRYIAQLLNAPDKEFHALQITSLVWGVRTANESNLNASMNATELIEQGFDISYMDGAGEILDRTTKAQYETRLNDLEEEIREAAEYQDPARLANAQDEKAALKQQLSEGFGLRGQPRTAADPAEKARKAVAAAINRALKIILRENPALGQHLSNTIHKGIFLSYTPEPDWRWEVKIS